MERVGESRGGAYLHLCKKTTFDYCRENILPGDVLRATQDEKDAYLECVWECFESTVLEWDDDAASDGWSQKIQYRDDACTYAAMEPTAKLGKDDREWRFTPIPDSQQVTNGKEGKCTWDSVTSFSNDRAQAEFIASFGDQDVCDWGPDAHAPADWHVFDKVKVPFQLEEGEYLLSWRWEGYMADQMWTNCADVVVGPPESEQEAEARRSLEEEDNDCYVAPTTLTPTKSPLPTNAPVNVTPAPTKSPVKATPPPTKAPSPPTTSSPESRSSDPNCPTGYSGIRPYDSCTKYHHCQNGLVDGPVHGCPSGTLFDSDKQYCNWENLVTCNLPTEGCYSNNFKDCNHPDFQAGDASCHTTWIPEGSQRSGSSCIALWGDCTNQGGSSCCEPAICHGDGSYAQCIVSSS